MYHISGHPAVFVTLMAVIGLTSFPRTLTDGFGVPTKPDSLQQTPEQLSTIGQELEGRKKYQKFKIKRLNFYFCLDLTHPELSQTIESKSSREESQNHVLPFSIISTETVREENKLIIEYATNVGLIILYVALDLECQFCLARRAYKRMPLLYIA